MSGECQDMRAKGVTDQKEVLGPLLGRPEPKAIGISPRTAEKHRANLITKMEVNSAVELMSKALKEGLIDQNAL